MIATVNPQTLQAQIKLYFEQTKKRLPKDKAAMDELTGFASFIVTENQKDIQDFIDSAINRIIDKQRTPNINEVYVNRSTGQKFVIDYKKQIEVQKDREQYFFVCKAPHLDNDFSYNCKNPLCKCNTVEFLQID